MKVRIKKTGEIMNADPNATVMLEYLDDTCCNIELPLDEIELIPESDVPHSEIERRKRITELAKMMYVSSPFENDEFDKCLIHAEKIIEKEDQYINGGECMLFPSKDQRDWSVWEEQQKPKRWRAKVDEIYYLINFDEMDVFFTRDLHLTIDDSHFSNLNYFRTAEQAKEAAKRIKQTLQNYHKEIGE